MALADAVRQARARQPEKQALIVGDRRWSYEEFDELTDRIGTALLRRGLRPGDRVALHFANSAELVEEKQASEAELQRFLKERIAAYKIPEAIHLLPELPKGLTGKIDRRALRERAAATRRANAA